MDDLHSVGHVNGSLGTGSARAREARTLGQGGKLNDLLGVSFAARHAGGATRFVLVHPGVTATGFAGSYDQAALAHIEHMKRHGRPVEDSAGPIVGLIDRPPTEPLSAFVAGERISVHTRGFDAAAASRLTRTLLSSH